MGPGVSWRTGVTVTGPDGRPWVVRRRWVPRLGNDTPWQRFHRRFRSTMERGRKLSDAGDVASDRTGLRIAAARRLLGILNSEDRFGALAFGEDINLRVPCSDAINDVINTLEG